MTQEHYIRMRKNMKIEHKVSISDEFPPTAADVRKIESELQGIIYDDLYIYISSKRSAEQIASTLIHEISHFLNADLYNQEKQTNSFKPALLNLNS